MDDILIIGGGIIGSSIAYHLARDGRFMTIDLSRMTYQRVIDRAPLHETEIV